MIKDKKEWERIEAIFKHHQAASLEAFRKVLLQPTLSRLQMILTLMEGMSLDTDELETMTPLEYGLFESVIELSSEWHTVWNVDRGEETP